MSVRYLALLLSILIHSVFVLLLLKEAGFVYDGEPISLGIELVTVVAEVSKNLSDAESMETCPVTDSSVTKSKAIKVEKKLSVKSALKQKMELKANVADTGSVGARDDVRTATTRQSGDTVSVEVADGASQSVDAIVLRQGNVVQLGDSTVVLKQGSESRSMGSLAGYSFNEDDFRGHYETATGREVVILDARKEHGRLVLHDRKTGLVRKLKKAGYGEFIYTYGPSFNEDEPVEGSVVFLPGDEHWIRRFMWLPGQGAAEYPDKGRVDVVGGDVAEGGSRFVPAKEGKYPAVILFGFGLNIPVGRFSEVARHLSGKGVVVQLVKVLDDVSIKRVVETLKADPKVDPKRIGLWVRGYRPEKMPRIQRYAGQVGFFILTIDCPKESLFPERVASAVPDSMPVFIGFRNIGDDWKNIISVMLAGFKVAPNQLAILDPAPEGPNGSGAEVDWVDVVSGDFVSSISAWLDSQ
ncbi:alpha/beta hydrolase family protein [Maridesulfovibrio sp. FT414]|uniref:alpha/beta hydrolase family protein n=1 Tax=Maridesulfovibrio sp. FT414 TaxID=2979469 RepID=UPI003D80991A